MSKTQEELLNQMYEQTMSSRARFVQQGINRYNRFDAQFNARQNRGEDAQESLRRSAKLRNIVLETSITDGIDEDAIPTFISALEARFELGFNRWNSHKRDADYRLQGYNACKDSLMKLQRISHDYEVNCGDMAMKFATIAQSELKSLKAQRKADKQAAYEAEVMAAAEAMTEQQAAKAA